MTRIATTIGKSDICFISITVITISVKEVNIMDTKFTSEEEKKIQLAIDDEKAKQREIEIQEEIRRRIAEENSKRPGYSGY